MPEKNYMEELILKEAKKYKAQIYAWSKTSCGQAKPNNKIKIPHPIDLDTMGVCFHEIGHIAMDHFNPKINKRRYVEEYEADQFALKKLREYGFYSKEYENRAINYTLMKIAQAKNRGHDVRQVPKEIIKWTGMPITKWTNARRVFVEMQKDSRYKSRILRSVKFIGKVKR